MSDERLRTKGELKRFVASNLKRKGWTDDMVSILIDVLWRDKFTMRTSGFYFPGGTDAIIAFDNATRIFSISPVDPQVPDFVPRFGFYSWSHRAVYHRRYETETIELPNEEGLFALYYAADENSRTQSLHFIKNPTEDEIKSLYEKRVLISFIYWDFVNQTTLYFGDDRHGSEWQPQMHYYLHRTLKAQVDQGLTITNMLINEDGSMDAHAQFLVNEGKMWHDDFIIDIPTAGGTNTIPILYFLGQEQNFPRFIETNEFAVYKSTNRICYNNTTTQISEATSEFHVMYHVFAINEHLYTQRKVITVMGTNQYETLPEAYTNITPELDNIYKLMPQQGTCYLGTVVFQTSDTYTNSVKARIVAFFEKDDTHPPVTIALDSVDFLNITESQILSWKGDRPITVTQATHGFTVGSAIRHDETIFVKAHANNSVNAQTCGIVTKVIDVNNFQYKSDGFLEDAAFVPGKEYFLSPTTAGQLITLPEPEIWNIGEVRQHIGFGNPRGLKIEIDIGDEIGEEVIDNSIYTEKSVTGTGSEFEKIKLVNDETTPAEDKYYGTDKDGARGYHELPKEDVQELIGLIPTFDLELGRGAKITLTGSTTITFSNLKANDTGHIEVVQDSAGGHTLNFAGATIHIAENSYQATGEVQLTSIAASKDIVAYWFTGSVMNIAVIKNLQL